MILPALAAVMMLSSTAFAAPPSSASAAQFAPSAQSAGRMTQTQAAAPTRASNTAPARVTNVTLYREAQQKLTDLRLYSGQVNGVRSASYVRALERFQRQHHIRASGRLTPQTRTALGMA
ncbi:MAG: peptidoglycan-binding domain-containing protein [Terricaulis sp.]